MSTAIKRPLLPLPRLRTNLQTRVIGWKFDAQLKSPVPAEPTTPPPRWEALPPNEAKPYAKFSAEFERMYPRLDADEEHDAPTSRFPAELTPEEIELAAGNTIIYNPMWKPSASASHSLFPSE